MIVLIWGLTILVHGQRPEFLGRTLGDDYLSRYMVELKGIIKV